MAALVEARTGREFVIEDDLELTFFPWLGVEIGGIRLGNAEGFGDEDFLSADYDCSRFFRGAWRSGRSNSTGSN